MYHNLYPSPRFFTSPSPQTLICPLPHTLTLHLQPASLYLGFDAPLCSSPPPHGHLINPLPVNSHLISLHLLCMQTQGADHVCFPYGPRWCLHELVTFAYTFLCLTFLSACLYFPTFPACLYIYPSSYQVSSPLCQ